MDTKKPVQERLERECEAIVRIFRALEANREPSALVRQVIQSHLMSAYLDGYDDGWESLDLKRKQQDWRETGRCA